MPSASFLKEASDIVEPDFLLSEQAACAAYLRVSGSSRIFTNFPLAVAIPAHAGQLATLLQLCSSHDVGVRTRGYGTRTLAATYSSDKPWIIISLARLNRILEIDSANHLVTVQAGAALEHLHARLAEKGLRLPLGATLGSIGGAIAAGAPADCHGLIPLNWLKSLKAHLADGAAIAVPAPIASEAGILLQPGIFYGSRGRLGVIAEVTARLELIPENSSSFCIVFNNSLKAAEMAARLAESSIQIKRLEFVDKFAAATLGLDEAALLAVCCEGSSAEIQTFMGAVKAMLAGFDARLRMLTAGQAKDCWQRLETRVAAYGRLRMPFHWQPISCPPGQLAALLEAARQIAEHGKGEVSISGSVLSGSLDAVILCDSKEGMEKMGRELLTLELVLNRALSLETEVGQTPAEWLAAHPIYSRIESGLLRVFDPKGIFSA